LTVLDPLALLDQPGLRPSEVAEVEQLVGRTLRTDNTVVLFQAEAITLLEAVASSIAGPDNRVLNVVTGPYGAKFGEWLRRTGAEVSELAPSYAETVTEETFVKALHGVDTVALVQAEAATGANLDLEALLRCASKAGALTVVDAVAAIGAEPIDVDAWGIDIAVIGGQKALAGPAGVSAAVVSPRAWGRITANPVAPRESTLSLIDWADQWLKTDRSRIPGTPSVLETRALLAALRRVHDEGIEETEFRHRRARAAVTAAVTAYGLHPWAPRKHRAAVCTTVALPEPVPALLAAALEPGTLLTPGDGPLSSELFRINHFGRSAELPVLLEGLARLGTALGLDDTRITGAGQAAAQAWSAAV
jgi:aspartate aminotransferase-like enzyme